MLRAAVSVGAFTLLSRLTGFVRDAIMLAILGAGPVFDAFIVAFKFPNFFRRLSAEGAFSAAFIPLFSGTLAREGQAAAFRFAQQALAAMSLILLSLVVFVEIFTPSLMGILAPGFFGETRDLATDYTRITFPYILFISLAALISGVLNSLDKFSSAAAAPVILNLMMIGALLIVPAGGAPSGLSLSYAVLLAGVGQYGWVFFSLHRSHPEWRFPWKTVMRPRLTPELKILFQKMGPGLLGAGVFQINVLVDIIMASFLPSGSLTFLHAADRLNQLPLSVIGVAISTAFLPLLSRQIKLNELDQAHQTLLKALQYAMILSVPAAAALFDLSPIICRVLFERGAFTLQDALASAAALQAFVLGLPAYILIKILSTRYFAQQDTLTPVILGSLAVLLNFILNILLIPHFAHVGIAVATCVAGWANMLGLASILMYKKAFVPSLRFWASVAQVGVATVTMLFGLISLKPYLMPMLEGSESLMRFVALGILVSGGLIVYVGMAWLLGLARIKNLRN